MKRRSLLAAAGVVLTSGFAGCVSDDTVASDNGDDTNDENGTSNEADSTDTNTEDGADSDDTTDNNDDATGGTDEPLPEYADQLEECSLVRLQYSSFPTEIQAEIDAALEAGTYESEHLLLDRAVDTDQSYIIKNGTPYDPVVKSSGATKILELEAADAVHAPEPYRISIENDDDKEYTVELRVESAKGETKFDTTVTLSAGERMPSRETTAKEFGTYTVTVELVGEETKKIDQFRIGDAYMNPVEVWISDGEVGVIQVVAELAPCPHQEFA